MYILQYYTTYLTSYISQATGRLTWLPLCDYKGNGRVVSLTQAGKEMQVFKDISLLVSQQRKWKWLVCPTLRGETISHQLALLSHSLPVICRCLLFFVFLNLSPRLKSSHQVTVRKKTVDATRMETKVPSTTKPNFTVEVIITIVHVHQNSNTSNTKPNRMESTLFLSTASPESQNPGRGEN